MAKYMRPGAKSRRLRVHLLAGGAATLLFLIGITALLLALRGKPGGDPVAAAATPAPTAAPSEEPTEAPTAAPSEKSTEAATEAPMPARTFRVVMPTPTAEGYLPIFSRAETNDKIIAITVDDFYQFKNARTIIDVAIANGAKLTLFPIGKNAIRDELQDTLRYAHENGMEIENHTFEHKPLYRMNDKAMARQIYLQCMSVNYVLGVDYQEHFFRPLGGDGRDDQRTHMYVKQLGMYGIAHWSVSGSGSSYSDLVKSLAPGQIYLFHTTDKDTAKLEKFIPAAVEAGYTLVTLNEMFGLPKNEVCPLEKPAEDYEVPQLEAYTPTPRTYANGDYAWTVNLMQQRLGELGYLSDPADGAFGDGTEKALGDFQKANGLKVTGKADPATQEKLFSEDAKRR